MSKSCEVGEILVSYFPVTKNRVENFTLYYYYYS